MSGIAAVRRCRLPSALALLVALACGSEPGTSVAAGAPGSEPIRFGEDRCSASGEPIERKRFGAELVTRDGAVQKFRSAECLARHLIEERLSSADIESLFVVDFNHGTRLIDVRSAIFLVSEEMKGPDALNLLAVPDERLAFNLRFAYGGREARWDEVLTLVREARENGPELCAARAPADPGRP